MPRTTTHKSPRLYWQAGLAADTSIELDRTQAHYLLDVMRKKVGDQVRLFNGADGEWLASISDAGRKRCQLAVAEQLRPQEEEIGPTLLFAPIKKARMEMLVEKATELGVGRLMPVRTRRSIVDRINAARLRTIAIEAAEQCERLTMPEICELQTLEWALSNWPMDHPFYAADETGSGRPLLQALELERPAAFLVGPEGGFDPAELGWLSEHQAVIKVDLGPRILRAETAGLVMLANWSAIRPVNSR
ncbi:MAG: 16S rRNA (uracil(1498)-N(3))-methyltransferase [Alphaproteobacteria bacterium]|nr:16S rRNA (uracil(1498)-N(3))-methyltransferase [Alphaproteobacteria bacterium]